MAISFCLVGKALCGELCQNEKDLKQVACQSGIVKSAIREKQRLSRETADFLRSEKLQRLPASPIFTNACKVNHSQRC
jgi:hypothetical protein